MNGIKTVGLALIIWSIIYVCINVIDVYVVSLTPYFSETQQSIVQSIFFPFVMISAILAEANNYLSASYPWYNTGSFGTVVPTLTIWIPFLIVFAIGFSLFNTKEAKAD